MRGYHLFGIRLGLRGESKDRRGVLGCGNIEWREVQDGGIGGVSQGPLLTGIVGITGFHENVDDITIPASLCLGLVAVGPSATRLSSRRHTLAVVLTDDLGSIQRELLHARQRVSILHQPVFCKLYSHDCILPVVNTNANSTALAWYPIQWH